MGAEVKPTGRKERGQSLVEFALLIPIMLVLVIGTAEFGRAWMMRNILTGAAREGARVASVAIDGPSSVLSGRTAAIAVLSSAGISVPPATVTVDPSPPTPFNAVQVDVTYTYSIAITGFIPGLPASFPLTGTATMRRERY